MPPQLVEALSTLLADALVVDVKGYPDLSLEPGAARKARAQSSQVESSAHAAPSTTPVAAADDPAGCAQPLLPPAHRSFLDVLAELIASEAIKRSRSEKQIPGKTRHTPQVERKHSRDDQGRRVFGRRHAS
jgi:hypothetical protein